ncbi:hypothetical protein CASFOL_025668 [Castilleja foliolosa]|uniref:F-box protein n=1 Tax=Castilleja foliolosa TaxID=1961234 RepID=A0ABD3CSY9_9LAMI
MESNGHIHCVAVYLSPKDKCLLMYELLDDSPLGWFELHRVDLNPIAALWPEMNNNNYSVLGIVRGEIEQESCVLLHVPGKVIQYRFCDRRFEVVLDLTKCEVDEEGKLQFRDRHTFQFIESLVPV